jgi:hypothetical protein
MSEPPRSNEPRLRPTNPATLLVAGLAAAAVSALLVSRYYGDIPSIPWLPAFTVFAIAIG